MANDVRTATDEKVARLRVIVVEHQMWHTEDIAELIVRMDAAEARVRELEAEVNLWKSMYPPRPPDESREI